MRCKAGSANSSSLKISVLLVLLLVQGLAWSLETAIGVETGPRNAATAVDEAWKPVHRHRIAVHLTPTPTQGQSTMLLLTNMADEEVIVRVEGRSVQRNVSVQGKSYGAITIQRPTTKADDLRSTTCTGETAYLTSRHPITVSAINLGSCASFLSLPQTVLGTRYEVITWSPTTTSGQSSVSLLAADDDVIVEISFPADRKCEVSSRGLRFFCGDRFRVEILRSESLSLLSSSDLSGTVINSTGRIAVFAGNFEITVGPGNATDQTVCQLLPVSGWQVDGAAPTLAYAVPSIPDNGHSGYSVKVSTGGVRATVAVAAKVYEVTGGQVLTLDFVDNAPVLIQADAPLQVIQFVRGATDPADSGAPAAQVIPELRQYASSYAYTNPTGYTHYVIVVIERNASQSGLVVDTGEVDGTGWTAIGGTTLVTRGIPLNADGYGIIYHRSQVPFGAFRYSYRRGDCAYAYPAGIVMATQQLDGSTSLDPTRVITEPWSPGVSGLTSDPVSMFPPRSTGPSLRPQQPTSPEVTTTSTVTEPSADVDCELSNIGTEFLIAFLENLNSTDSNLSLYPVTFSASTDINVKVELGQNASDDAIQSIPLSSGERVVARVPPEVELKGIEGSRSKAVKVTSNRKVSVFGMNSVQGSCDGFLALPVTGLGTDYYTVSFFPPDHKTQIALIALHDDTQVNVTLRLPTRPGLYIKWNGTDYTNSLNRNTIQIAMNELDVVQLQDNSDMTGTRVTSNRPLAVFTGNDYSRVSSSPTSGLLASHLVEQIPPVTAWGRHFHAVPLPETGTGYFLKVVASSGNTTVTLSNASAEWQLQTMANAGDFRTSYLSNQSFVSIRATRPVLVAQFAASSDSSSPTMMVLPPVEQYRSTYSFSTGEDDSTRHFLLLVADLTAVPRLQLDSDAVDQSGWTQMSNGSGQWANRIRVTSGVHVVTQLDGMPFGAYLYGQSVSGCAYAYPAGLCLQSLQDGKTTSSATTSTTTITSSSTTTIPPSPSPTPLPSEDFVDDCSCLKITSHLQPTYSGLYFIQTDLYNGLPVYQTLDDCPLSLYRFQQEAAYWIIGPTLGMSEGAIQSAWNDSSLPNNVTRWRAFSAIYNSFLDDVQLSVECSCPVLSVCRSVEFINITTGSSILDGVFVQQPTTSGAHPVFKHDELNLYLYYRSGDDCPEYWTVSDDLFEGRADRSEGRGLLRLEANATDPVGVVSADSWTVFDPRSRTFQRDAQLRLVCYNDTAAVS